MSVAYSLATSEFWLRGCIGTNICLKEALLEILHDPTIGGLPSNKALLFNELQKFKHSKVGVSLTKSGILKSYQWQIMCHTCNASCSNLCPKAGQTDSEDLDVTSIIVLIRNCTNIPKPKGGWSQELPQSGDTSTEACVLVIRFIRNFLMHCSLKRFQTKADFHKLVWDRMEKVLLDFNYKNMALFHFLENASLDQYTDQRIEALNQRFFTLEDNVKDNTDDIIQTKTDLNEFINIVKYWKDNLEKQPLQNKIYIEEIQELLSYGQKKNDGLEERLNNLQNSIQSVQEKLSAMEAYTKSKNEYGSSIKEKSNDLKKKMKSRYEKVKVAYAPSDSLKIGDSVDRADIIVELSMLGDASSVSQISDISGVERVSELRKKQKEDAENRVNYEDILISSGDFIVISGGPGSGKTTLSETLVYEWASEALWNDYEFVFIIYLRDLVRFKNNVDITAQEIFSHYYPNYSIDCVIEGKALLLLEGFDELHGKEELQSRQDEFTNYTQAVYDLLDPENQKLPFTRIVTSRPGACSILKHTVLSRSTNVKIYEVLGFSDENIKRYIEKHFHTQNADTLIEKLQSIPFVFEMMVIPFYCWGICYLVKNDIPVEELGQTRTSLYTHLLILFIRNHGLRNPTMKLLDVLENEKFKDICLGLSYIVVMLQSHKKIIFTKDDLQLTKIDIYILDNSGLIIEIQHDDSLHYTFHEYLEALNMFIKHASKLVEYAVHEMRRSRLDFPLFFGFLGGIKRPSKSSPIVQRFCRLFHQHEPTEQIDYSFLIATTTHAPERSLLSMEGFIRIAYEFQNKMIMQELRIESASFLPPLKYLDLYLKRCCSYFRDCCRNGQIRIKRLGIIINDDCDKDPSELQSLFSCGDDVFGLYVRLANLHGAPGSFSYFDALVQADEFSENWMKNLNGNNKEEKFNTKKLIVYRGKTKDDVETLQSHLVSYDDIQVEIKGNRQREGLAFILHSSSEIIIGEIIKKL